MGLGSGRCTGLLPGRAVAVAGRGVHRSHLHLRRLRRWRRLQIVLKAPLLIDKGFNHLRRQVRGACTPAAMLPEHRDDDIWVAPRSHADKPGIGTAILVLGYGRRAKGVVQYLRGAGFPRKINAFQMRCMGRAGAGRRFRHAVGDDLPGGRIKVHLSGARTGIGLQHGLLVLGRQLVWENHMRPLEDAARSDAADGARELDRRQRDRALADPDRDRLARIPLAVIVLHRPLFTRHGAGDLTG